MMGMVFGKLRNFVMSRAGSTLVGVLVLLILVWYGGPYVGLKDTTTRLIIMGVILGIALLYMLITWIIAKRRGGKLQRDLQDQGGDGRQAEIEALKTKMSEAVASLKTSELGLKHRGTAALYALPWYMIIGPSAAGKSTLLRNSGLHFPYSHSDDVDIKGFGGTRNCDWWFSDEAVILDTAGRYTTEEDDHDEWIAFLQLLKKHRRKMPINGIVVAISIADLLTADEEALEWHVNVIRDRVDELINELGFLFPLYLVFTKCDLLNGFQSYFGDLGDKERGQLWGSVMDGIKAKEDPGEKVAGVLDQLYARLSELRIRKLSMQRKHATKTEIFDFPAQFQAASERLIEFINLLFKDNPYQEFPNFKGVYFTSGTQEGLPLQRVVGNLRQAFGYVEQRTNDQPKSEKSYFINELLRSVIFKSPRDALMGRRKRLFTRTLKSATVLASLAVIIGGMTLFSTAFTRNTLLMKDGTDAVEYLRSASSKKAPASYVESYDALAAVYRHYVSLKQNNDEHEMEKRLGFYRADAQIEPLLGLIIASMEKQFLVPVAQLLEKRLQDFSVRWAQTENPAERTSMQNDYYNTLLTYLMLSDPERLNDTQAFAALYPAWRAVIAPSGSMRERQQLEKIPEADLEGLLKTYLKHMHLPPTHRFAAASWEIKPRYVQTARSQLRTPPNAELLYAQVKNKGQLLLKELTLHGILKSRGSHNLGSEFRLPVFYTRRGWETFVSREIAKLVSSASRGDWVLGTDLEKHGETDNQIVDEVEQERITELERQIRRMYFDEYATTWMAFLGSIEMREITSISDAASKLQWLSRADGPLGELLTFTSDNIHLAEVKWEISAYGRKGEKGKRLNQPVPELNSEFAGLRRFSDAPPKKQVSERIEKYLLALSGIQVEMERLRGSSEREREAEMYAANILSGRGGETELYKGWVTTTGILNGTDARVRRAVEPWLMRPIYDSWRVILASGMKEVQQKWINMVVNEYDERIRGRFPFASSGPDAAIDDVAEFFRPGGGILWSFVDEHLSPYLVKNRSRWRERSWLGIGPDFSPSFIHTLNRSAQVTRGFFKRGGDSPDVTFYLYPMPTTGLSEISLESNGQVYRYRNEPQEWRLFSWPGEANRSGARVIGVSDHKNVRAELNSQGLWGLFHLFNKAKLVKEQGAQYMSVWTMQAANGSPVRVRFKVKADRFNNVFTPGLMQGLAMPERLASVKPKRNTNLAIKE